MEEVMAYYKIISTYFHGGTKDHKQNLQSSYLSHQIIDSQPSK